MGSICFRHHRDVESKGHFEFMKRSDSVKISRNGKGNQRDRLGQKLMKECSIVLRFGDIRTDRYGK